MSVSLRRGLLVVLAALVPVGADACCLLNPFHRCGPCGSPSWIGFTMALPLPGHCLGPCGPAPCPCGPSRFPSAPCNCGPTFTPQPAPSSSDGPLLAPAIPSAYHYAPTPVCTTLQPRQVTTYRNVPTVEYRREAYVENVPVTTYEQITVPRTVYQPQTRYRDVAYTVNRQVAQTHTEYVRQPSVSYAWPVPTASAPGAIGSQPTAYSLTPQSISPAYSPSSFRAPYAGPARDVVPTPIALPPSRPASSQAATLQPPQPYAENSWQTVPQRQAEESTGIEQMSGYSPAYSPPPVKPSRSMFQPAPSAASVWQSRWLR